MCGLTIMSMASLRLSRVTVDGGIIAHVFNQGIFRHKSVC